MSTDRPCDVPHADHARDLLDGARDATRAQLVIAHALVAIELRLEDIASALQRIAAAREELTHSDRAFGQETLELLRRQDERNARAAADARPIFASQR